MSHPVNQEILFVSRPSPNASLENFKVQETAYPTDALNAGEILVKIVFASVDPYMRGRMNEGPSYAAGWELGKSPAGGVIIEVLESKNDNFAVGDLAVGFAPWKLYQVISEGASKGFNKIPAPLRAQASYFIGACGMPGLSAFLPIKHIADAKPGETAFISGAAGAVGSVAGQILKLKGLKVLGSAGTDDKVELLKEFGFDHSFNYNKTDLNAALKEAAPEGIDVFFDNVGGQTLETLLNHMKKNGRIICCGAISGYDKGLEGAYGVRNLFNIITRSLKIQGFIVSDWAPEFKEGTEQLVAWVKEGKIKVQETFTDGFENIPKAFLGLLTGANQGKMIVRT